MVSALAALEAGAIGPDYEVYCPGHMELGNHRFHCWKRWGHGRMDVVSAIEESCDVFFYDVSRKVGIDAIAEMARRFGIGVETGVDLPGEAEGLMPTKAWKLANRGETWQQGETLIASIGQGYVLATPLQLAVMTARLVNGGRAVLPHLTLRFGGPDAPLYLPPAEGMGLKPGSIELMIEAMIRVTGSDRGTARAAQIPEEGLEMGGKTGTSQVRRITPAERAAGIIRNEDLPWARRDHALFVGFAPLNNPRYVASVVVEHGGGGSAVAAPIARDLLWEAQKRAPARPLVGPQAAGPGAGGGSGAVGPGAVGPAGGGGEG
jgi:penicillin-binding protein 2